MNLRKHWDDWGWVIPAVAIVIVFCRLLFGREAFCAEGTDEHCLREWISALGAWAAVPAAVITVMFLSRQVTHAEKHSRQVFAVQLKRWQTIAHRSRRIGEQMTNAIRSRRKIWEVSSNESDEAITRYRSDLKFLAGLLRSEAIRLLEDEINIPDFRTRDEMLSIIDIYLIQGETIANDYGGDLESTRLKEKIDFVFGQAEAYAADLIKVANATSDEVKTIIQES